MLTHKTHGVYAKSYARKKVVVLAFRAEKVQRIQGVLIPHQAGGGIYGLPPRLTRKYHGERNNKRTVKTEYSNALETFSVSIILAG